MANIPAGFESAAFRHADPGICPMTGLAGSITMLIPVDRTGWAGVFCGKCGQQMIDDTTEPEAVG